MTRNSPLWWLGILAGLMPVLLDQVGMLHLDPLWTDRLKAVGAIVSTLSALLRMSPLALSDDSSLRGTSDHTKTLSLLPTKNAE